MSKRCKERPFAWLHSSLKATPPLQFKSSIYTMLVTAKNKINIYTIGPNGATPGSCAGDGSTISTPLFPARIQTLVSPWTSLKTCSGVLLILLKTRLFLSFQISQTVSMTIDRTPCLLVCWPLLPISTNHWPKSSDPSYPASKPLPQSMSPPCPKSF